MAKQKAASGINRVSCGRRWPWIVAACILAAVIGAGIYLADYYHAGAVAGDIIAMGDAERCDLGWIVGDTSCATGFIFYPGGKVEASAYLPLLKRIADEGVLCVLCEMPFNLAVLNGDAANEAVSQFTGVERWYVGGHSLGGSMAAKYAAEHPDCVNGLVLLGAYPVSELPASVPALLIYGSEDGVMNRGKYAQSLSMLPEYAELVVKGGNHAGFGDYGAQSGDGTAAITPVEQREQAAIAIARFILGEGTGPDNTGADDIDRNH